jgi:hypothetical protein
MKKCSWNFWNIWPKSGGSNSVFLALCPRKKKVFFKHFNFLLRRFLKIKTKEINKLMNLIEKATLQDTDAINLLKKHYLNI